MLSEAFLLSQALGRNSILPGREHPRVKSPGRSSGPCLRVLLAPDGTVSSLCEVDETEWSSLWTVMESNQNSFPVVRHRGAVLDVPASHPGCERMLATTQGDTATKQRVLREVLLEFVDTCEYGALPDKTRKLWDRLRVRKSVELLNLAKRYPGIDEIGEVCDRFAAATDQIERLYSQFAKLARTALNTGQPISAETLLTLLCGGLPNQQEGAKTVQLAFDLAGHPRGIYRRQTRAALIDALLAEDTAQPAGGSAAKKHPAPRCAFTGEEAALRTEAFPKVKLPVLGQAYPLSSMFSDAGCNSRYGLTDSYSVPVGREAALRMQDALAYVVAPEREGRTWRGVPSGKRDVQDLLIVFLEEPTEGAIHAASLFDDLPGPDEMTFAAAAEPVCAAFRGLLKVKPHARLALFVIRGVSKGQAQVVLAERPSVQQVLDGAEWWQQAARNVPEIALPVPIATGERARWQRPQAPMPGQVVNLLTEQWVEGGHRALKVPGIGLHQVIDLLLRQPGRVDSARERVLDLCVARSGPLLVGIGGALVRGGDAWGPFTPAARIRALRAISTLAIALDSKERRKEEYMNSPPFLVGRLLQLADTLHREYCKHVRKGQSPPQLMGNALMPVAIQDLSEALARLCERIPVYQAWATRAHGSQYVTAQGAVDEMEDLTARLTDCRARDGFPKAMGSAEKAELFLGYMAHPPRTTINDGAGGATADKAKE